VLQATWEDTAKDFTMTFRSFIRDGGVDKKGGDVGPKFCVGLIVSNGEQGVRRAYRTI